MSIQAHGLFLASSHHPCNVSALVLGSIHCRGNSWLFGQPPISCPGREGRESRGSGCGLDSAHRQHHIGFL